MRIEYFEDLQSSARPVLLAYGSEPADAAALQRAIDALAAGHIDHVSVASLPGFLAVNGCSLTAQVATSNIGVTRVASNAPVFSCALDATAWSQISGLLEPFTESRPADAPAAHQYLSSDGDIDWIVATSRQW